jgi:glycosyltransferase domain-containing protein
MRDFTLVIPTYNRTQLVARLLTYLETEKADCRVLVLDSSDPEMLAANRARVAASSVDIELAEFPDLDPTEKWRQGIHKVTTPFCALCADDDIVILEGVRRCLDVLRRNPVASAVQGYSFTFLPRPDGDMELNNIVDLGPTIDDSSPLGRLDKLFRQYRTPRYGVLRTRALQRIFDALRPMTKILSRELLSSALTAVEGQLVHLPAFTYGRSIRHSDPDEHWHPLEWFCKNPEGLFAEYLRYRELLAAAIIQRLDNEQQPDEVHDILDLIHLRYLAQHAPDSVLKFVAEQQMAGVNFAEYWPRHEIHLPLYEAAGIRASVGTESFVPVSIRGRERSYLLFPNFYARRGWIESPQMDDVVRLINILDGYRAGERCESYAKDVNAGAT